MVSRPLTFCQKEILFIENLSIGDTRRTTMKINVLFVLILCSWQSSSHSMEKPCIIKQNKCENCNKPKTPFQCGDCHLAVYCSKECQRANWKNHKDFCRKKKAEQAKISKIKQRITDPDDQRFINQFSQLTIKDGDVFLYSNKIGSFSLETAQEKLKSLFNNPLIDTPTKEAITSLMENLETGRESEKINIDEALYIVKTCIKADRKYKLQQLIKIKKLAEKKAGETQNLIVQDQLSVFLGKLMNDRAYLAKVCSESDKFVNFFETENWADLFKTMAKKQTSACQACHKKGPLPVVLCDKCEFTAYCSKECQDNDFALHKGQCNIMHKKLLQEKLDKICQQLAQAVINNHDSTLTVQLWKLETKFKSFTIDNEEFIALAASKKINAAIEFIENGKWQELFKLFA